MSKKQVICPICGVTTYSIEYYKFHSHHMHNVDIKGLYGYSLIELQNWVVEMMKRNR